MREPFQIIQPSTPVEELVYIPYINIYGPAGSGKTTLANRLANVYGTTVLIDDINYPYKGKPSVAQIESTRTKPIEDFNIRAVIIITETRLEYPVFSMYIDMTGMKR